MNLIAWQNGTRELRATPTIHSRLSTTDSNRQVSIPVQAQRRSQNVLTPQQPDRASPRFSSCVNPHLLEPRPRGDTTSTSDVLARR